jgi:peptidoglycan/xylan/chitin deacetylase (PgdA/CDA1 family)
MTQPAAFEGSKNIRRIWGATPLGLPGIPLFNYHGLTVSAAGIPEAAQRFWLAPTQFGAHLTDIRETGFRVVVLEELKGAGPDSTSNAPMVVVTFDDGLASDYKLAFPLLTEFRMKAVFFVNTSTVGQAGYSTWSQITEMHRAGMSIQSHSHRHLDLTVLPAATLQSELANSKRSLEDHLGCAVEFLAAPHGLVSRRVVRSALAQGYRAVCSTRCWPANPRSSVLSRITLHREITPNEFHAFLTGELSSYARRLSRGVLYRPRTLAERLVGTIRYRWLREVAPVSK